MSTGRYAGDHALLERNVREVVRAELRAFTAELAAAFLPVIDSEPVRRLEVMSTAGMWQEARDVDHFMQARGLGRRVRVVLDFPEEQP